MLTLHKLSVILEKFLEDGVPANTPIAIPDTNNSFRLIWNKLADSVENIERYIDLPESTQEKVRIIYIS